MSSTGYQKKKVSLMKKSDLNIFILLSFSVLLLFSLIGGLSFTPRFFNKLRHAYYFITLFFIVFSFRSSFGKEVSLSLLGRNSNIKEIKYRLWLIVLIFLYLVIFVKVSVLNYLSFNVHAVDFSLYDWLVPSFLRTGSFHSPACNCNHMGLHQTMILFISAPFHYLVNHPIVSVVLHPLIAWSAIFPLLKLMNLFKINSFKKLIFTFLFFNFFGIAHIVKNNLHVEVYYIPLILWLLYFLERSKHLYIVIVTILICMIKEDAPLYLFSTFLGFYLFRNRDKRLILYGILSLIFFIVNIKLIIPSFKDGGGYTFVSAVSKYGHTIEETVYGVLNSPLEVIKDIFMGGWIKYVGALLFIPVLDFFFIIAVFPFIFIHSIAATPLMSNLVLYYSAPFIPFLFYSYIKFMKTNRVRIDAVFIFLSLIFSTLFGSGYLSFKKIKFDYSLFRKEINKIDKNELVCAADAIFPHFDYSQSIVKLSPRCKVGEIDIFVLHNDLKLNDVSKEFYLNLIRKIELSKSYSRRINKDGFIFYSKN